MKLIQDMRCWKLGIYIYNKYTINIPQNKASPITTLIKLNKDVNEPLLQNWMQFCLKIKILVLH